MDYSIPASLATIASYAGSHASEIYASAHNFTYSSKLINIIADSSEKGYTLKFTLCLSLFALALPVGIIGGNHAYTWVSKRSKNR